MSDLNSPTGVSRGPLTLSKEMFGHLGGYGDVPKASPHEVGEDGLEGMQKITKTRSRAASEVFASSGFSVSAHTTKKMVTGV